MGLSSDGLVIFLHTAIMPKKSTTQSQDANSPLTKEKLLSAATNDSSLSRNTFTLGDRTFPLKDLTYDQYNKFLLLIAPLADGLIGRIGDKAKSQELGIEGLDISLFSVSDILSYCGNVLPELALIAVQATDPNMTVEQVKNLGKTPFKLAEIVMLQLVHNNTIKDFADFFARILPLFGKK
jgi:hypothetical protein